MQKTVFSLLPLMTLLLVSSLVLWAVTHTITQWSVDYHRAHQPSAIAVDQAEVAYRAILKTHLFGRVLEAKAMSPSSLPIRITGIVKMSGQERPSKVYLSFED